MYCIYLAREYEILQNWGNCEELSGLKEFKELWKLPRTTEELRKLQSKR